ncbi:MAG: hypothetical protein ACQETH_10945 [Candidatus Rifleibacteriota bacterium]
MKNFLLKSRPDLQSKQGFAIMIALVIGTIMLILAVSLFSFVGHQHTGIQNIVNGEVAHFLAEAGINSCIGTVREAINRDFSAADNKSKIRKILLKPGKIEDICINDVLGADWNRELEKFAAEVDSEEASINVDVWLRDFELTETSPAQWSDPVSKEGYLVVESTAEYKNSQRVLSVRRQLKVSSTLPGPLSKFTLYVKNASRNGENSYNLIRNDYRGTITDGPKPLICYNHQTPESPFSDASLGEIFKEEKNNQVWQKRGWIYMGPDKIRLNLCSGAGELGEIFHFYDVSNSFDFEPVKFVTPENALPPKLQTKVQIPWDLSNQSVRTVQYEFEHSFVLDGFHDRSNRKETDAMYEGNILSDGEENHYTSRSSILHLYGDARKGYQSRTRIFGPVTAAFPRFASLKVSSPEPDVQNMLDTVNPPPLYLVPSRGNDDYHNSIPIKDALNRNFGGPLLKSGMICENYSQYSSIMSRITEQPYVFSYNSMQDVYSDAANRIFPSQNQILTHDNANNILITGPGDHKFFEGKIRPGQICRQLKSRTQQEIDETSDFWEEFINESGELELNQIVHIKNSKNLDFIVPPSGSSLPLQIKKGGMVILEQGNLVIRGLKSKTADESLTIVAPNATSVSFPGAQPAHVNLIAPSAELSYSSRLEIFGNLCVGSIFADHRFQGGTLKFRSDQDPTDSGYQNYYKTFLDKVDSYWHE